MGALRGGFLSLDAREQLDDRLPNLVQLGAELLEDLSGDALTLADETEQDVLGSYVIVTQLQSFAQGKLENFLGTRREGNVPAWGLRPLADDLDYLRSHRLKADSKALQAARGDSLALMDKTKEDVLGPYVIVIKQPGFFLGKYNDSPGPIGESFKHLFTSKLRRTVFRAPRGV
jgi:hypothetical protein